VQIGACFEALGRGPDDIRDDIRPKSSPIKGVKSILSARSPDTAEVERHIETAPVLLIDCNLRPAATRRNPIAAR